MQARVIARVECAKCRRECDLSHARATLCGDRARRVREMQARVRFVRCPRNPLRRSCASRREMQARVRFVRCLRNTLRRSCVSSARNAGEHWRLCSVLQECPTRVSHKSVPQESYKTVPQECPTRVSHKSVLQKCPTRVSRKSVPQECPIRVSHKSVLQECSTRVSYKSVPQECPTRVSHKSVLQECHLDICSFSNVFPFGFVGSILFIYIHTIFVRDFSVLPLLRVLLFEGHRIN